MFVNSINEKISNQKVKFEGKSEFKRIDLSFQGNLMAKDVSKKLSKDDLNIIFKSTKNAGNVSFNGQNLEKRNVLITGGAGYIGSHTAKFLLEHGYNVVVLDNLTTGNKGAISELKEIAEEKGAKFEFYKKDLSD